MASDVIESEVVLKGVGDMNLNNSNPDCVTPSTTGDELGNKLASSLSSSGVSGEGNEEEVEDLQNSTVPPVKNGEDTLQESPTKTRVFPSHVHRPGPSEVLSAKSQSPQQKPAYAWKEWNLRKSGRMRTFHGPYQRRRRSLKMNFLLGASEERDPDYVMDHGKKPKKKLSAPNISLTFDRSEGSLLSDELDESTELDLDDIDTPSDNSNEFEWEDDLPKPKATELLQKGVQSVQESSASEEREEGRRWRVFRIGDQEHRVDMKAIEPYKRVFSHGGYYGDGLNAIIVFAVCFMPESNQPNYRYIMDNLFKYVIGTLELLVAENYMIVYLNGATSRKKMPTVGWLRKCYQQIDRRLRKNLKSLIIVHPSWFIRTLLALTKPFISTKFSQKIKYVYSLTDLAGLVPMEYVSIPDCIKQIEQDMHGKVEMAAAAVPE
ncbi:unnamed protein product [Pleuronectes platessa]|uniref:CRAL-TRIO domain-containing protein n=1 Tax=Pleuronectes platessa TaxID=8262 RepID=A0A9N7YW84_PLEPL|nr:unnamed protein product [Pleuronectes platessa]